MTFPHQQCSECDGEALPGVGLCSKHSFELCLKHADAAIMKVQRCEHCGAATPLRVDGHACCSECTDALHPSVALAEAAAAAREYGDDGP